MKPPADRSPDTLYLGRVADGALGADLEAGERAPAIIEVGEVSGQKAIGVRVRGGSAPATGAPHQHVHRVESGGIGIQNLIQPPPPPDLVDLIDPWHLDLPAHATHAQHLVSRFQVVDFVGCENILAELHRWADDDAPVGVRLIYGHAGAGKTRLGLQWVRERREQGPDPAGFITGELTAEALRVLAAAPRADLVLDYAEVRPWLPELLAILAKRRRDKAPGRLRLLLLAREPGDWWARLRGDEAIGALLADAPLTVSLGEVPPGERADHFALAARCFQAHRSWPDLPSVPELSHPLFARPLYLHMAAYLAGEGCTVTAEALLEAFLDHEARFWWKRAGFEGRETGDEAQAFRRVVEAVMAAVTLRGGSPDTKHFGALLEALEVGQEQGAQAASLVADLYGGTTLLVGPLEPDLLGEALVLRCLREGRYLPGWAARAVRGATRDELLHAFIVMGRAEVHDFDVAVAGEGELLAEDLETKAICALVAVLALGAHTADIGLGQVLAASLKMEGNPALATALEPYLPAHSVGLREVALWVARSLLPPAPSGWRRFFWRRKDREARGRRLNNLVVRLAELGLNEEAVAYGSEAVAIFRRLPKRGFQSELATSLNFLGNVLSSLERNDEALDCMQEAVAIHRGEIEKVRPMVSTRLGSDFGSPDLAMSLDNLGNQLAAVGRREEALAAAEEALKYRRWMAKDFDLALPDLANSLSNTGSRLAEVGRHEDALAATLEGLEIRRRLADLRPDAFLPEVGSSLHNLSVRLQALRRHREALHAAQDAIVITMQLAQAQPDAFLPDFANGLNTLGVMYGEVGLHPEALSAAEDAVGIYRSLAQVSPQTFLKLLAMSVGNLSTMHSELGNHEEAIKASKEAVELFGGLARTSPGLFSADHASCLGNLARDLLHLGHFDAALAASNASLELHRELAQREPEIFTPRFARDLNNQGAILSLLGRHEEAIRPLCAVIELYRELARNRPDEFVPSVALAMSTLGDALARVHDLGAGRQTALDALDLLWPHFQRHPAAHSALTRKLLDDSFARLDGPPPPALLARRQAFDALTPQGFRHKNTSLS